MKKNLRYGVAVWLMMVVLYIMLHVVFLLASKSASLFFDPNSFNLGESAGF